MAPILYALIGTADMTRANAFAKIEVMKQVLRSVKEILWPTDGREADVVNAVKLAVFELTRSAAVFNASRNFTRQPDSAESTCNETAVSADATKSDNVEGSNVEKNEDERVIPNLPSMQKSVLRGECSQKLNDCMGVVGIDGKRKIAVGTTSGIVSGFLPINGELDFYINAAIPIGHGPPITRFNQVEKAIILAREENMPLSDAIKESGKILNEFIKAAGVSIVISKAGVDNFYTNFMRMIWVSTNGTIFAYSIDNREFIEEF